MTSDFRLNFDVGKANSILKLLYVKRLNSHDSHFILIPNIKTLNQDVYELKKKKPNIR
jgi:hypothetical protein